MLSSSRTYRRLLAGLILFWAIELLVLQQWTTLSDASIPMHDAIKDASRRFVLNLAGCTALVCLFGRWSLRATFVVGLVMTNLLVVYANYFGSPLSWPVLSSQWREGLAVSDHGMSLVDWRIVAISAIALAVKVAIANAVPSGTMSRHERRRVVAIAGGVYLAVAIGLAGFHKPLRRISLGTPEYVYGYVVAWAAEAISLDNGVLLEVALTKARGASNILSETERTLLLTNNVAIIQVESLDFDVIESEVDGEAVMPFLRGIQGQAMLYCVKPYHFTGSSEADFSMLTAAAPNGKVNPFQIQGFPYEQALPWLAQQQGYQAVAFHGNTGEFFHRRDAYEQMGFSDIYFTEELEPLKVSGHWDRDLLEFSADLMEASTAPTLHFVITITSHGPFDRLLESDRELFEQPTNVQQRYLNSMRYVDRVLENYIEQLPMDTTVVLYGDHESNVHGYCEDERHPDRVPWLILQKGRDLSTRQDSRESGLALSGELSQLDMACYFRNLLARTQIAASKELKRRIANKPFYGQSTTKL
ncbi:LTA synthase family protein [Allorhodopirellula heiligendammensis]|uniref:Lipoteichoic acid synthase 2 n=1 Tax=Allorhodopirellula heiligendammensis TaxID=2714739 RepID=A0A5C6BYJ4_9BACT|nr:LTA synthase family protein [Allorhodopirellula heiligendammensis]TWU16531.1 Lipoteichoic acid synthase 2 [Allorhodopirellula heiligendammensis]|tara:strand:+ start:216 stop:1805 length:1590 start_codon:yes stop_codon:yes gene_type:complete